MAAAVLGAVGQWCDEHYQQIPENSLRAACGGGAISFAVQWMVLGDPHLSLMMGVMSYVASIVDATLRPVLQKLQNDTLFVSGVLGLVNTGIAVGAARLFLMGCKVSLGTLALPQLIALNLATYVALRFFNKADDATPYLCCMFWR